MATEPDGFVALRGAFDRFYRTLEATTVPADAGGRMVGGFAHAVVLSEATDALYVELAAASRRLFKQHGRAVAECPPGVVLLESDSPDGPWTPIPTDAIAAATMGIGGDGADAVLMAALESATKAASFPIDKWNAMQAARPGANHQRFHAGEVVSAKDLDVLESASKLLRLMGPPAMPTDSTGDDEAPIPAVTVNEQRVLRTMDRFDPSRLLSTAMIAEEMAPAARLADRTIGPIVRRLIELGLAERPEGDRNGARLTRRGRRLASKIAD